VHILFVLPAIALASGEDSIIQPNITLVIVLILFLIFVFVLNQILFKPVSKVLNERESLTEGAAAEARAAARQYQTRLANYEEAIRQARAETYRRLEQGRKAALEDRQQVIDAARARAESEISVAREQIAAEAVAARFELERESRQIAEQISRTILGRAVGGGKA
jgi:F-type H+-transporting ATPase subunit b